MAYQVTNRETEILQQFYERLSRFVQSSSITQWRNEMKAYYRAIASDQWNVADYDQRIAEKKPCTTFNNTSSLIRCISGYEIVNRSKIDYYARLPSVKNNNQVDMIGDVVQYIQDDSGFFSESSYATEDVLVCGLGATVTEFDYFNPNAAYGEVEEKRIFAGFLMYDNQTRGRNLNRDARWAGYIQPVASDWLDDLLEEKKGQTYDYAGSFGVTASELISFWDSYTLVDNIDIIYNYEWREPEKIWRCKNPFTPEMLNDPRPLEGTNTTMGQFIAIAAARLDEELGADLMKGVWQFDRKQYKEYRNALSGITEVTGIPLESQGQAGERNKYYQARIARGCVIDWQESWCQSGFTITYKTGYFDERRNCFYGVMRDMLPIQQALNEAVSNYVTYLQAVPMGGQEIEIDAVENIKDYIKTRANAKEVTVYLPGGLGKSRPKQTPQPIGGLTEFILFCKEQLAACVGLTADFIGSVESGNMSALLYGKIVRQSRLVLAPIMDSNTNYLRSKGAVYLDASKVLIENSNGMILRRMSGGKSEQDYESISTDALNGEYDIVVTDRPMTDDERQERFNAMIELYGRAQNPALLVLAIEDAPLDEEQKQRALQAMQPPPPPPPSETDIAMVQSQIAMQQAQAESLAASAAKTRAEAAEIEKQVSLADDKALAEIRQKVSAAELNEAKTQSELVKMVEAVVTKVGEMQSQMAAMQPRDDISAKLDAMNRAYEEKMQQMMMTNAMLMRMDSQAEAQAAALEAQRQAVEQAAMANQELTKAMTAPRRLMRDAQGNAIGVQVGE